MKSTLMIWGVPALLVATMALPVVGWAQSSPMTPPPTSPPSAASTQAPAGSSAAAARVEKRITDLHAELHITAAEAPQWTQFAQVMRENARKMGQTLSERSQKFRSLSAVDNMQSYTDIAAEHAQDMQKLTASFKELYNSLSEAQKKTADQVFRSNTEKAQAKSNG